MDYSVKSIGERKFKSPLVEKFLNDESIFVSDSIGMRFNVYYDEENKSRKDDPRIELAGARDLIYFNPEKIRSAIVTCGGLCPGLNNVIRSIVMESHYIYGSKSIIGIPFGYNGLNEEMGYLPIDLTPEVVVDIHKDGGTMLGSSRGGTDDMEKLVDSLARLNINILYAIGGDGTLRGAHKIAEIALKRGMDLAVIGVPKTIDNDISFIQRSFGFETSFAKATESISSAHVEASGAPNGVGLVKLMGRHSGFIAVNATLAMGDVNYVLIPEVPFELYGKNGFLEHLKKRLQRRHHAVICVAEGAGQDLLANDDSESQHDASGNVKLDDIGLFLKEKIKNYFKKEGIEVNLKYIDPSYNIRSTPANPNDAIFCEMLGQYAVHAGMAGKTDIIIGQWNNIYAHIPIELAVSKRKQVNPNSRFWYNVIQSTGQPESMVNN